MNANTKRIAAISSIIALVALSGCASFDATVAYDGNGGEASHGDDILKQMHDDTQRGGE
jgi:hypothetical protein